MSEQDLSQVINPINRMRNVFEEQSGRCSRRVFGAAAVAAGLVVLNKESSVPEADAAQAAAIKVRADFGQWADYPIVKSKFAIFNSCIVPLSTYERDAEFFGIVGPESLRIDLGWGTDWAGWSRQPIDGPADAPTYHFEEMDDIAAILNEQGVLPYWSYCYTPTPLQVPPGEWKSVPQDMAQLAAMLGDVARHYRELRGTNPVGYHEVFNEPDNDDFTVGDMNDYFRMYELGSVAIRENDPDGLVGGPALAFTYSWIDPFVDLVADKDLPIDFFSTHIYGTNDAFSSLDRMLDTSRDSLDRYPQLSTVEIHLNEFNSYVIDYPIDGTQQRHRLAAAFLRDMHHLLARPELTLVHWAQFLDSGMDNYSGMISIDGHRKAVFNAAEIYARLPVDRVLLEMNTTLDIGGMAGIDEHRAGLVIWNLTPGKKEVLLDLRSIPFATGTVREYRIDEDHSSWGDGTSVEELQQTRIGEDANLSGLTWSTTIGGDGVLYLEIDDVEGTPGTASIPLGRWVRTLHYYPDRASPAYADFDKRTWTFRMGTAEDANADLEIGVTAENVPDAVTVSLEIDGTPQRLNADTLLGLRVDYFNGIDYTASVLFHGPYAGGPDLYDRQRAAPMPWGTGSKPDNDVSVEDLSNFVLSLSLHAPADWNGRVQVTAMMHAVGANVRARLRLRQAQTS
ncbi:MAG: hypothetical protein M3457_05660 [Chloroflexota bacterium]|nr:hypothetical protein [Chloroflexota bacterium]